MLTVVVDPGLPGDEDDPQPAIHTTTPAASPIVNPRNCFLGIANFARSLSCGVPHIEYRPPRRRYQTLLGFDRRQSRSAPGQIRVYASLEEGQ